MPKGQSDAVPPRRAMDEGGHIRVKGVHQLLWTLDDGDLYFQLPQILRQLQADEAPARQHDGFWVMGIDIVLHTEGVLHCAQCKDLPDPNAGEPGLGGTGSGREDQLVIMLLIFLACLQSFHGDSLFIRMNSGDLVAHPHIHPEAGEEALWRLEDQGLGLLDHPTDIVGQAAVGVGDIP